MAAPSNLRLTGLDFDELRSNFKNYLETQEEFTDYDSTGSAFSVLLDVLSFTQKKVKKFFFGPSK